MKPCQEYIDLIQRGVDGELSDPERERLETHLAACPGCRALYDTYENIQTGILEGEEEPPEELSGAVMRSIRREKEEKKPLNMVKRWKFTLIAAAAVLVIVVAGKYVDLDFGASSADTTESAAAEAPMEEPEAAPAAGAAAEEGAAFQAAPETAETEEEAVEEAAEEAEAPGESPTLKTEGSETTESQAARYTLDDVWKGLHQDGYSGNLYQLTMTEEEFLALLPDCEKIQLSSGPVVYRSSVEDFKSVQTELRSNCSIAADTESDDIFYWLKP